MAARDTSRPLDVVDAAYAAVPDEAAWLAHLLVPMRPLMGDGSMLQAFSYRLAEGRCHARAYAIDGLADASPVRPRLDRALSELADGVVHHAFAGTQAITLREIFADAPHGYTPPAELAGGAGFTAIDATFHGVAFVVLREKKRVLARAELRRWHRLGAHVTAGFRLRRRVGPAMALAAADAVFDTKLRVVHVAGTADRARMATLMTAADAVRHAHGRLRTTAPDEALELWRALFDGRWSVRAVTDTDGKRFFAAEQNAPAAVAAHALDARERLVVGSAALGHGNKLIAYELGLPVGTVARLLGSARRKLGVGSRAELVHVFSALARLTRGQD